MQFDIDIVNAVCADCGATDPMPVDSGTFKSVFHATLEEQSVAIKIIKSSDLSARTVREINILDRCDHSGIAALLSHSSIMYHSISYHYLVEEFLAGGALSARMASPPIACADLLQMAFCVVQAVEYLTTFGRGCVHRDIKPDNIMFRDSSFESVLTDFGLARLLGDVSITASHFAHGPGTPFYASPEQLNNQKEQIDWRSDQFSLGVTLAQAITGKHPFHRDGEDAINAIERVATRGTASEDIIELCEQHGIVSIRRMLSPYPVHRYRRPADLLAALRGD